jgi:hypothetical protein
VKLSSVPNLLFSKWLPVSPPANYSIGSLIPCYALLTVVGTSITVHDIQLEAYSDTTSLIIGLSFLAVCFSTMVTFILITILERRRRRRYDEIVEIPSDFRYQKEEVIYRRETNIEDLSLELILQSFEDAQSMLWRNQHKLREHTFDRLRHEQVDAVMGSHAVKIKFQQNVYAALKAFQT